MIKSYKQIIVFLVKSAKKNADSKGINFNEEKSIKMHEAVLPLIIFYILVPLINFIAPAVIMVEIYLSILVFLIIRALNNYFGWIKIIKKD